MAQSLQIDGLPILDVIDAREELDALGYPAPDQLARANSILNPLGSAPCRAWLLLSYASLSSLSKESTAHQITWQDHAGNALNFYQFVFVRGRCLTPGKPSDPTAIYLCEFADRQWLADNPVFNVPISLQYNVAAADAGAGVCYYDTTNAGTNWTWAGMWANLWTATVAGILGSTPALPVSPNGTPWNFIFPGLSGWRAIDQVLTRIGCALNLNPLLAANQISVVQVGAADAAAAALLTQSEPRKLHDEFFVESQIGKIPTGVVVYFHRENSDYGSENTTGFTAGAQWQTSGVYAVSIAGPSGAGESGTYHPIWDDLPALYPDTGTTPSNVSALTARAQERANDFYRWIQPPGGDFQHRTYSGLIPFQPGSTIRGVAWRQDGNGLLVTEVVRHPFGRLIITETGQWEEEDWDSSTALQPPDFRPSFPNYPHLLQTIKLTSGSADGSGRFPAVVEAFSTTGLSYSDNETCWAVDANRATTLVNGNRYPGRLSGYNDGAPVYQIYSGSGFTGTYTIIDANCVEHTVTVVNGSILTVVP